VSVEFYFIFQKLQHWFFSRREISLSL
jgi:hypothetical protein